MYILLWYYTWKEFVTSLVFPVKARSASCQYIVYIMWGKKTLTTRCNCNTRVWRFIAQDILWVHVQIGHHGTPVLVNMRVCLVKRGGPVLLLPLVVLSPSQAGVKCNLTASTLLQGPESVGIATIFIFYWFWRNADSQWTQLSQYASMHMHTHTHHRYPYKERSLDNVSLPRGIPPPFQ